MVDDASGADATPGEGDAAPMGSSEPPPPPTYPVRLEFEYPASLNRFWAVPVIGFVAKIIVLIPHFVVLSLLGIIVVLSQLVIWAPVLFTGAYPDWGYALVGGYLGWTMRVSSYFYGLTDGYPVFGFRSPALTDGDPGPVRLSLMPAATAARWPAIPLVGLVAKEIILIPHLVILYGLGVAASIVMLIAWAPVLFTGVYPVWARDLLSGYLRWSVRVQGYFVGLTDRYPPFGVEN
ncbi:MAG TPA: DUF4389 domain-containing protein [Dehalococcoidia bacterium]|nr:DUF4389 domain-containing protein [Dehalococcoidia bacterium]